MKLFSFLFLALLSVSAYGATSTTDVKIDNKLYTNTDITYPTITISGGSLSEAVTIDASLYESQPSYLKTLSKALNGTFTLTFGTKGSATCTSTQAIVKVILTVDNYKGNPSIIIQARDSKDDIPCQPSNVPI